MINDSRRGALVRGADEVMIRSVPAYRVVGSDDRTGDDVESPLMNVAHREAGRTSGTKLPAGRPLIQTP
jgi:hypothetical protein